MSHEALLSALTSGDRLDASKLTPQATDKLASMLLALDDQELATHLTSLSDSPNFVGSDLFDRTVARAPQDLRHTMWATGEATQAQARQHFAREKNSAVRQVMALRHRLSVEDTREALANPGQHPDGLGVLRFAQALTSGRGAHLPVDVLVDFLVTLTSDSAHYRLVAEVVAGNAEVARAVVAHPRTTAETLWVALAEPGVPEGAVLEVLAKFAAAKPATVSVSALAGFVRRRPVMTAAEWDAATHLVRRHGPAPILLDAANSRVSWELSEDEFVRRAQVAAGREQLEGLVSLVPEPRWGATGCPLVRAVVTHPDVTPELVEFVARRAKSGPAEVAGMWAPTEAVWDHQWLLARVLTRLALHEVLDVDDFGQHRSGWLRALSGRRAKEFTAVAALRPQTVLSSLWRLDVPWSGDLTALALVVPQAGALRVGSGALLSAVVNTIEAADGGAGTLWALFEPGASAGAGTVGDVIAAHAAAAMS